MATSPHTQEETQEDITARLALIRKAVEEKLATRQQGVSDKKAAEQAQNVLTAAACPIDPMERLLCESCQ